MEKGGNAVTSELDQLNEMKTFAPIDSNRLTKKDMSEVLAYLMLLTEKGIEELKGEHVTMGEKNSHT